MGALYDSSTLRCSVVDIIHSFIASCISYMYTKPYRSTRPVSTGVLPAKSHQHQCSVAILSRLRNEDDALRLWFPIFGINGGMSCSPLIIA